MSIAPTIPSVVALRSHVPEDAFTAGSLGTLREGSGVIIRESGLVLTIGYLITEAEEVWLTTQDGRVIAAHALAYDQETGFGLVQALQPLNLPALEFASPGAPQLGDRVMMADGSGKTTTAVVVARQEFAGYWEYLIDDAIFTAPEHDSWGGAALLDSDGALLGIGSLQLQMLRDNEVAAINMSVPVDLLRPILDDLLERGRVNRPPRPWLGVFAAETNGEVVVMNVAEGGPAEKAGLRRHDVISEVRDGQVGGLADFYRKLWHSGEAGSDVPMRIVRDGRDSYVRIHSADRESFLKKPNLQ